MRPVVYVAGPYTGPTHDGKSYHVIQAHIWFAREWAKKLWEAGAAAICPHMNTAHFECDCSATAEDFYEGDLALLKGCDAIFMMPEWEKSRGARLEKEFCEQRGILVFHDFEILKQWIGEWNNREAKTGILESTATARQNRPTGVGALIDPLVVADAKKHRLTSHDMETSYFQLMGMAFLLKRRLTEDKRLLVADLQRQVSADIEERGAVGQKKYGTRLRTHNGRSALVDAYQEILDAIKYFRQAIEEGRKDKAQ